MPKNQNSRPLRLMYLIAFLQGMVFYGPVATLYRTAAGVTVGQIALIESISYLLMLLLEIPWGLVTARIGMKNTLAASCALYFVSKVVFWRAGGFAGFLAERALLAVVLTGFSGCDTAYLYHWSGDEEAQKVLGRFDAWGMAGLLAASAVFSGWLGGKYRLAALLTVGTYGAAALASLLLAPVPLEAPDRAPAREQLRVLGEDLRRDPRFLLFLLACACLTESCQLCTVFFSQPLYRRAGMPEPVMGLWHALATAAGLAGAFSHRAIRLTGEERYGPGLCLLGAVLCALLALSPWGMICGLAVVLLRVVSALFLPYAAARKNRHARGGPRSVLLSGYAMAGSLGSSGINYALGQAADWSLTGAVLACGGLCFLAAWFVAGSSGGGRAEPGAR